MIILWTLERARREIGAAMTHSDLRQRDFILIVSQRERVINETRDFLFCVNNAFQTTSCSRHINFFASVSLFQNLDEVMNFLKIFQSRWEKQVLQCFFFFFPRPPMWKRRDVKTREINRRRESTNVKLMRIKITFQISCTHLTENKSGITPRRRNCCNITETDNYEQIK